MSLLSFDMKKSWGRLLLLTALFALPVSSVNAQDAVEQQTPTEQSENISAQPADYAILVSKATFEKPDWAKVVQALNKKHGGEVIVYDKTPSDVQKEVQKIFPKYICFVAAPEEAGREFISSVYDFTCSLDEDPYIDAIWAVLTGYDAENALAIAEKTEPLTIHKVAGGTEFAMSMVDEGQWFDELVKNKHIVKKQGGEPEQLEGPDDTVESLVSLLNDYKPDLWITSGHASEHNWMPGYTFRAGTFQHKNGTLFGASLDGEKHEINSPNTKIYMPIGNCLAGHVDGKDCMMTSYLHSAGVIQALGYTIPTGFGYAGWGCLDYFVEQPGRYTFIEACIANQQALRYELEVEKKSGKQSFRLRLLQSDEKVLGIYGDPAWVAKMSAKECAWEQTLTKTESGYELKISPNWKEKSFEPVNINGSERGGRPIFQWLPNRVKNVKITAGSEFEPVITDNFILIPLNKCKDKTDTFTVEFDCEEISAL